MTNRRSIGKESAENCAFSVNGARNAIDLCQYDKPGIGIIVRVAGLSERRVQQPTSALRP